jgi:hypothetical protein
MSIIKKTLFDEKLETINVLINDEDATSKYFKLTELPDTFTGGKNAFLIQGSPDLVSDTIVKIQIKDAKGNTIYYEPGEGIPEYYEGTSKVVSVYIYPDTAYGPCTITILGELKEYESNGIKTPVPENWKDTYNVKWEKQINVNPSLPNITKIRFYRRPKVDIQESILNIYNREIVRSTISGSVNGIAELPIVGSDYKTYKGDLRYKLQLNNGNSFSQSMVGETITINGSNINNGSSSYVSTIKEVLTKNTALVTIPYYESASLSPNYYSITNFISQSYTTSFVDTVTLSTSNISSSFAKIKITDLETFSGDANRVKVYASSKNSLGDFQLLEDIQLESNELLLEDEFGGDINVRTGIFTETILNNFWISESIETGVVTSIDNDLLLSSVKLQPIADSTSSVGLFKFYNSSSIQFTENTEYQLDYTPLLSASIGYGKIEVYGSGSAFINTSNELKYGKLLAELETPTIFKNYDKQQINFKSDSDGNGNIVFLVKSGVWQISNVSLRAAQESAFSPNEVTLVANIPTRINNETFDFKVELYDVNNNYVPVKIEKEYTFNGGNDTVTGLINAVTGAIELELTELSQSISGTITFNSSSVNDTVVELSSSVSTSIDGVSGSLFNLSGSVSSSLSEITASVSSSFSASTAYALSQSNYTFNLATDELQKLADGEYSGSFIGDTTIYSPSIGGQNGYISNIFKVGQNGITLDGTNKAIYIGNGVYNNVNTPFYFASGSTNIFSLADKLSWDGGNLTVNGTINVVGGNAATQTYANVIGTNSIASASLDATTKSTNAITSASLDATTKASTAQQTAITVSAISASNAALSASAAFTNAKAVADSIANGTYSGGTLISSTSIISPVIAGANGYISNVFKVGNAGITLDGYNKAIYIGSGVYGNTNTGFYVDSNGNFSLKDKLTWDSSTLTVNGVINITGGNAATQTYANVVGTNSIISASLDATTKSTNAITSASLDATSKANSAEQTAITVSAISASNAALSASAAFTNAKAVADSIANGTYSGGTLISSTSIISPVIAGANGYISNVFKVGTSGITLDGNNKSIYIGTGVYNNTNTGFYVDSTGNFSLKDKLTWNGTTLSIDGNGTFSGALVGGTISIGSGNSIFKADTNGIYLGNTSFGSAPFRVNPDGALTASSGSIAGWQLAPSGLSKTSGDYILSLDSTNQKISIAKSADTVDEIYDIVVLSAEENIPLVEANASVGALDWNTLNTVVQTYNYQDVSASYDTGFEVPDGHNQTRIGGYGVIGLVYASEEIYVDPEILFTEAPVDNVIQVSTVGEYISSWQLILRVRKFPTIADADSGSNADVTFGDKQVLAAERIFGRDSGFNLIDEQLAYGATIAAAGGGGVVTPGDAVIYKVELKQIWSVEITNGDSNDSVTFQRPGGNDVRVQYTRVDNGYSTLSPGGLQVYQGLKNYASFTRPTGTTGDASNFMLVKGKSQIIGSLNVSSGFTAASKQFKIQHPIDDNKWLYHTSIESPRADLIYRGVIQLVNGVGTISIDSASNMMSGTYVALTKNQQLFLQNESGFDRVIGTVIDGIVSITSENPISTDTINWMVIAERNDVEILQSPLYSGDGNYKPERYKREYINQLYKSI